MKGQECMGRFSNGCFKGHARQAPDTANGTRQRGAGAPGAGGATRTGAPAESADHGPSFSAHLALGQVKQQVPKEEAPGREGVTVVINSAPPRQQSTATPGWLDRVHPLPDGRMG